MSVPVNDLGLDNLSAPRPGQSDQTSPGPFDKNFPPPNVGGATGDDPTDPNNYQTGAFANRDHRRDVTPNGYYSSIAFYFILYMDSGVLDKPKNRLIFPVNPATFEVSQARSYGTYDLVAGKQGMQIGQLQLRQITFSSFLPCVYDEDYCVGHNLEYCGNGVDNPDPMLAVQWVQARMRSTTNIYFAGLPISSGYQQPGKTVLPQMACHITNFNYYYQPNEPLDVYFDIELTEHRDLKVTRTKGKPPSGPKTPSVKKVTTKVGDSFIDIAKQVYGANYGNLGSKLKAANPGVQYAAGVKKPALGSALKAGTSLKIPDAS